MPINPRPFLQDLYVFPARFQCELKIKEERADRLMFLTRVNKDVFVRLKWGETEYKGRL